MSQEKKFKRGDAVFLEGDNQATMYLVQAGKLSAYIERNGHKVEFDQPPVGHILGESGVFGQAKQSFSIEAHTEVKVLEIPVEPIKMVFEKLPAPFKIFVKALGDEVKRLRLAIRTIKMEQDNMACPPRYLPRLCAIFTMVTKQIGKQAIPDPSIPAYKLEQEMAANPKNRPTDWLVSFSTLKIYTGRMFLESVSRMQSFCDLLSKLGIVTLKFEKNEETEQQELTEIRVHDLLVVEHFGEFFQHNFFKAGKSEVIHLDKTAVQIVGAFFKIADGLDAERGGLIKMDYKKLMDELKSKFFIDFKEVHVGLLEKKGLYLKRQNVDGVVWVSWDKYEWQSTYRYWQIIQEVDRWNQLGRVDLNENLNEYKQQGPAKCAGCDAEIAQAANFCPQCGAKVAAAA